MAFNRMQGARVPMENDSCGETFHTGDKQRGGATHPATRPLVAV